VSTGVRKARLAATSHPPPHPPSQDASALLEHGEGDAGQSQRAQDARTDGQGAETGDTGSSEARDVRDRGVGCALQGASSVDGADGGKRGGGGGGAPAYVPDVKVDDFDYHLPAERIAVRSKRGLVMYTHTQTHVSAWSLHGMQCADLCGLVAFARCAVRCVVHGMRYAGLQGGTLGRPLLRTEI
jgi:hypothetical protein